MNTMAPSRLWTGALVFMVPALCLTTGPGIGLASFLLLLSALCMPRASRAALARHWPAIRWVVLAFLFNFVLVLLQFLLRPEQPGSSLEKQARMFFAASALAVVLVARPPRQALWWGAILGAIGAFALVAWQHLVLGIERPGGMINAITFGDIVLTLALLSLVAAIDFRRAGRTVLWPLLGGLAGVLALVITGTRGAWLAAALGALVCVRYGLVRHGRVRIVFGVAVALVALLYLIPATSMQARVDEGIRDVRTWYAGGDKFTNLGIRLELWKGAGMLIAERPLLGRDHDVGRAELAQYVRAGRLDAVVLPAQHLHNDALQALANGGVFGLLALFGILAAPFAFFARQARAAVERGQPPGTPALAGMLVALGYFAFGLTEMMFWSGKACIFYALMIFILMGLSLNQKEELGH
ncbi:MAG: O-antigen ligase family protein [Pseudomonadota bacterium]